MRLLGYKESSIATRIFFFQLLACYGFAFSVGIQYLGSLCCDIFELDLMQAALAGGGVAVGGVLIDFAERRGILADFAHRLRFFGTVRNDDRGQVAYPEVVIPLVNVVPNVDQVAININDEPDEQNNDHNVHDYSKQKKT